MPSLKLLILSSAFGLGTLMNLVDLDVSECPVRAYAIPFNPTGPSGGTTILVTPKP